MSNYTYIPSEAARRIAAEFHKDIVCIVAIDHVFECVQTTTYGVSAHDKIHAAELGPILNEAAGGDMSNSTAFEDFRQQADHKETIDKLSSMLSRLLNAENAEAYINGVLFDEAKALLSAHH